MAFRLTIIEKIISIFLILWAGLELFSIFYTLETIISFGLEQKFLTWNNLSFSKIFKNYHLNILVSILSLFSAAFLLFQKRIGWILTIAVCIINIFSYLIPLLNINEAYNKINNSTFYLIGGILIAVFSTFITLLLQKGFRDKYYFSTKMCYTILIITSIYLTDRILLLIFR